MVIKEIHVNGIMLLQDKQKQNAKSAPLSHSLMFMYRLSCLFFIRTHKFIVFVETKEGRCLSLALAFIS